LLCKFPDSYSDSVPYVLHQSSQLRCENLILGA